MLAKLRSYRFLLSLLVTTLPLTGYLQGQTYNGLFVGFVLIPILDLIIGRDIANPTPGEAGSLARSRLYEAILYAYVPVHLGLIGWGMWVASHHMLSPGQITGLALSVGFVTGAQGITFAHELGHRRSACDRWLSRVLLVAVGYGHFYIEHNRGHHVRVATHEDPASARYGESFYRFYARTLWGSFRDAWSLEAERLGRLGMPAVHWRNQMIWLTATPLAIAALGWALLGWPAAAFFAGQSVMAFTLLEIVNYVEHYGLTRAREASGRDERVSLAHSWNASERLTNCFLIHLQRHPDHHVHPTRPYQLLEHHAESPQLPTGYSGMVLVALVPPLWFALMNPRVVAWRIERGLA